MLDNRKNVKRLRKILIKIILFMMILGVSINVLETKVTPTALAVKNDRKHADD